MPIQRTEAIVLNRRDFRETSLIIDFYTKSFGKMSGLLKGARAQPFKFASALESFSHNEIIFYQKRNSSLHLVTQCDAMDNFDAIRKDVIKTGMSSFMMELLWAVMAWEDKNEEVFNLSLACLKELNTVYNPYKVLNIFKIKILTLSGFKPHFDSCISCNNKILEESKFSLIFGGLLCARCSQKDIRSRSIFRGTIASILHIEKNDIKNNLNLGMNPQIKKELDFVLNSFLQFHLEKEFRSQRVLNKMEDQKCLVKKRRI